MSFPNVLQGTVEKIAFCNEQSGFTVARLQAEEGGALVTIVGLLASVCPGEVLRLEGRWVHDKKFGEQFRVESYSTVLPATVKGIEKYLSSGLVKGIGPVMASRLTAAFGKETLEVIDNDPERLLEVEGIGKGRLDGILNAWQEQMAVRDIMVFLHSHGVGPALAVKIYRAYRKDAIRIVQENPYNLSMDIQGVGFKIADRIAGHLGIPRNSRIRAESGILFVLDELVGEGHCYYPEDALIEKCKAVLEIDEALIEEAIKGLQDNGKIIEGVFPFEPSRSIYLRALYLAESNAARHFSALLDAPSHKRVRIAIDKAIQWVEEQNRIQLAPKQKEAIKNALERKVLVITGGPGTGKTTIINSIIQILERKGLRIGLAAPTGRAAKRLSETTNREASTIHRLLKFSPRDGTFKINADHPLEHDLIIVDEASMVDILLLNHLLKAIPRESSLILVGDSDQLPSVGPGNVLRDLIESQMVHVVTLTEIFRQARESRIVVNAHQVRGGLFPEKKNDADSDFFFLQRDEPERALETILELCTRRLPQAFDFDPIADIQVISPMHKGIVGVGNLNNELQALLNPKGCEINRWGRSYRLGDKVMQIRNNYDKDIYNGDCGRIVRIDLEQQELTIRFDDREIPCDFTELDELIPAYAISVHKSQGSEYPAVIIPILTQHYILLQRNLLYTAITRGRKMVILVGSMKAIAMAVKNDRIAQRYTHLKERLRGL